MSASPAQQETASKVVLPFPSASRQAFQALLDQLAATEHQIVLAEPNSEPEEELFRLWKIGSKFGRYEWVIKCFASSGLWEQTSAAKRGRGNKDVTQRGILAAVSKKSKKLGVTPATIYLNARIFRLVRQVVENVILEYNILDCLDEKGYWEHALLAADPQKAILEFAAKKMTLPRFRVTDAERLVLTAGMSRKAVALKAVQEVRQEKGVLSERQSLLEHIRFAQNIVKTQILPSCHDPEFRERVWDDLLMTLGEEFQELFDQDASDALIAAWDKGSHREDQLVSATGFPLADVSRVMGNLSNMSEFIRIQPRDINQRSTFQLWHKVGEPFDNAMFMPMAKRD